MRDGGRVGSSGFEEGRSDARAMLAGAARPDERSPDARHFPAASHPDPWILIRDRGLRLDRSGRGRALSARVRRARRAGPR